MKSTLLNSFTRNNSPSPPSPIAGQKRPPPSLLPAFEPLSSSPSFPRLSKRQACAEPPKIGNYSNRYPTPIPSSTTGILSSPPPYQGSLNGGHTHRILSSEPTLLSTIPTITLPMDGEIFRMGRSSKSSNFQLSSSRLVSRVHVEARYIVASTLLESNCIEIKCKGWNGLKLHCLGRTWELAKDDSFTSRTELADIMLDVQDCRVFIVWPGKYQIDPTHTQDDFWDEDDEHDENRLTYKRQNSNYYENIIPSSPIRCVERIGSSLSPSPIRQITLHKSIEKLQSTEPANVQVYDDMSTPVDVANEKPFSSNELSKTSIASLCCPKTSELSDADNEIPEGKNDPDVDSFCPALEDLSSPLTSISTRNSSVSVDASPLCTSIFRTVTSNKTEFSAISNHLINQLAYSLKSSLTLSELFSQLPDSLKGNLSTSSDGSETKVVMNTDLRKFLNSLPCIGEISREGKDAAGKPLESEYYYILEEDKDDARQSAVKCLRKPSLRSCRKKHKVRKKEIFPAHSTFYQSPLSITKNQRSTNIRVKQYFWRKPKTP